MIIIKFLACLLILVSMSAHGKADCNTDILNTFEFVLEYALWRDWRQAIIYTPEIEPECKWALVLLTKCLGVNGVASAVNTIEARIRSRLGIIVLSPKLRKNSTQIFSKTIQQITGHGMNSASFDWLVVSRSTLDFSQINHILNQTAMRFDQNLIVAFPEYVSSPKSKLKLCDGNFVYNKMDSKGKLSIKGYNNISNITAKMYEYIEGSNYYKTSQRYHNITRHKTYNRLNIFRPLLRSGLIGFNFSKPFHMSNISQFSLRRETRKYGVRNYPTEIYLLQYFKLRINSTLYTTFLGPWSADKSVSLLEVPYPVEARKFMGETLAVGKCNCTTDGAPTTDDDEPIAVALMNDILQFLAVRLNATPQSKYYSSLGFRNYEGTWSGLLGALMDHSADIALEPVAALPPHHEDMDFIFPIVETVCNIYIRHQETSAVRDIFLAPFNPRLIACVVALALTAALTIMLISRMTSTYKGLRRMGSSEALIWSTGILCQQGGSWTPPNPAASIVLIVCLLFAVVIYNAYAAFITSVLSVRVASVATVADVLQSPSLKIGYIRNGEDQMYLMSTKDAQLNAFYIRGYSEAENLVSTAEEGLVRAASQDYAFFAGQQMARQSIRSLSQARGRCSLRELPVHSTRAHLAFPLPRRSPYARPILVSLLQLRSGGALARLANALVPAMPQCTPTSGFASARAADVQTALYILAAGLIAASILGMSEHLWKNRQKYKRISGIYLCHLVDVVMLKSG